MEDKQFWDIRARSFSGYREGDTVQAAVLGIIKSHGVDFEGAHVLDLGCGAGSYALHIAKAAKQVTALDISPVMLGRVKAAAASLCLANIDYVESDWAEYEPPGVFDILFCARSPALRDSAAVEKAYHHASQWGIHLGSAGPIRAHTLAGLFDLHGIQPRGKKKGHGLMKRRLIAEGVPFTVYPVEGEWRQSRNYEAMLENCCDAVMARGVAPNREAIKEYIAQFKDDASGLYVSKTGYKLELLIWRGSLTRR